MPQRTRQQKIAAQNRRLLQQELADPAQVVYSLPHVDQTATPKDKPMRPTSSQSPFVGDTAAIKHDLKRIGLFTVVFFALEFGLYWLLVVNKMFSLF